MSKLIKVGIVGATGYTGIELVKILINHKKVKISELTSESYSNMPLSNIEKEFNKYKLPILKKNKYLNATNLDIVFVALPHIESQKFISKIIDKVKIIDLSGDFRLKKIQDYKKWYSKKHLLKNRIKDFVYGLPEINRRKIINSNNISVPGCYPTSVLLPLLPIIKKNLLNKKNIIIDSKSGYSGAGKKFNLKKLIKNKNYNFYNYNPNSHRHIPEIEQEIFFFSNKKIKISFNPHILPIKRGIISSIYCELKKNVTPNLIQKILSSFYKKNKFIKIIKNNNISLFDVIGTNNCLINIAKNNIKNTIIIQTAIDNLLKGASGQAVQNMNLMFNFNEYEGLQNIKFNNE